MSTVSCESMFETLRRLTSAYIFFHHLPKRDPPHVSHIRNERKSPANCCLRKKSALCSSNSHFLCAPHSRRRREKRKLKQIRNSLILISLHLSLIEYWGRTLTHVLPCRYRLILPTYSRFSYDGTPRKLGFVFCRRASSMYSKRHPFRG